MNFYDNPHQVVDGDFETFFHMLVYAFYCLPSKCDWEGNIIALKYNFTSTNYLTEFNLANDYYAGPDGIKDFKVDIYDASNTLITSFTDVGPNFHFTQSYQLPSPITVHNGWYYIITTSSQYCTGPATQNGWHWREMYFSGPAAPPSSCDTDGDGFTNQFDLDSDADGCPDAIEGDGTFTSGQLNPNTSLSGGVNAVGIPIISGSPQGPGSHAYPSINT